MRPISSIPFIPGVHGGTNRAVKKNWLKSGLQSVTNNHKQVVEIRLVFVFCLAFVCKFNLQCNSVTIPDPITSISPYIFYECYELKSVTIPDSVTSIGKGAFEGCSNLTSIAIPDSVPSIGEHAFNGCSSLTSIRIPDSVTSIGDCAFEDCSNLTNVTISDSVTDIGDGAFDGCDSATFNYIKTGDKDENQTD